MARNVLGQPLFSPVSLIFNHMLSCYWRHNCI
jgi:hypothetical protein